MEFWSNKNVLVTGGAGFVGSCLVEILIDKKANVKVADNLENGARENLASIKDKLEFIQVDLGTIEGCIKATENIDIVLNLAAKVGGIEYNNQHPSIMLSGNIRVSANMLEASRINNVGRFLVVSSACVYPRLCTIPTPESEGFKHVPEPTNEGYGWAKRIAELQGIAYANEYGMEIAIARPYNCYGPRDHFNPEKSHVIPALIKRVFDGENPVKVWGDGEQSRAFLFVEDFARGLIEVTEKYAVADPVNIGTDEEIKIKDLIKMIIKISGRNPEVIFDLSKPSGQPRRNCDNTKAKNKVGFVAKIKLEEGLKRTIEWYKKVNNIK